MNISSKKSVRTVCLGGISILLRLVVGEVGVSERVSTFDSVRGRGGNSTSENLAFERSEDN